MRLRCFQPEDEPVCRAIYQACLEAEQIPDQYEEEFLGALRSPAVLTVILEGAMGILGCGSIAYVESYELANLSFGLIHPNHQKQGYGSLLLVGRLSLLVESAGQTTVFLSATENSVGFYGQVVGFQEYDREIDENGNRFFALHLDFNPGLLLKSQDYCRDLRLDLERGLVIPIMANPE